MGVRFLTWFLFASCIQAISSSDFQRNFSSEQTGPNPSKPVGKFGIIKKEALRLDTQAEEKYKLVSNELRSQRGKGAYGGANLNHHPSRTENSASSVFPCILSPTMSLALIVLFSFHMAIIML